MAEPLPAVRDVQLVAYLGAGRGALLRLLTAEGQTKVVPVPLRLAALLLWRLAQTETQEGA